PDLQSAHVIRAVANVKFKRVFTSHSGCHVVALTCELQAYVWGRNEHHQLSYPLPESLTEPHTNDKPSPTPMAPEPVRLNALPDSNVPPELKEQKIVYAACGRGHTILVTDQGEAWSAGWNVSGQCGRPEQEHISSFQRIKGGDLTHGDKIIQASAGVAHSLLLTEDGKVFAVGTAEKGVLGNGRTGEHIAGSRVLFQTESEPLLVKGAIEGKKIVQITSGQQHNVALDSEGYCYAWGFGGLGRLGLGVQADSLIPAQIPYFANSNPLLRCKKIAAGSTNTLFIDNQDMVLLCGKFKVSGDGSAGQPWMTPRYVPDIMGYKWSLISGGGVTIFCHAKDPKEGNFTVCWGQTANYGELALGEGAPKSATKPQRIEYLDGIEMLDLAAGQNSTFFIAPGISRTDNAAWEELQRWPPLFEDEACKVCGSAESGGAKGEILECEKCEGAYHAGCLTPPIEGVPDGEWFCPTCDVPHAGGIPVGSEEDEEAEEEEEEEE
ncbi:RCC1/BLIP-II protein, partial [Rhodotorula sp. JG-1b]